MKPMYLALIIIGIALVVYGIMGLRSRHEAEQVASDSNVLRVFIKNTDGKLLILQYGDMHPSRQWTVPSDSVQGYALDVPSSSEELVDIDMFFNPIPSPEARAQEIALKRTGLSVQNTRLMDPLVLSQDRIHWDYVAEAQSSAVVLPDDTGTYYTEYRWVTRKELEEILASQSHDIFLTSEQLDMLFGAE